MGLGSTRKPEKALTALFVKNAKEPGKYFDGHGLFLRVQPSGAKQWVQRIVIQGKRCELGLGNPSLVSLSEARDRALENRRQAQAGGDPLKAKQATQAIPTFAEAARKVHEIHSPSWRNEKHAKDFITSLETYAFPSIGTRKMSEISTMDVLLVLQPIWLTVPETARRVRQRIGSVLKWAIAQGWRQDNPAENIAQVLPRQEKSNVHRKALPYAEVAECLGTVKASKAWLATKLALEFLVLNASRSGEVREARWDEIDWCGAKDAASATQATWEIPPSRTKTKRRHRVPLSRRAIEVLREAAPLAGPSGLIFPSMRGKALSDMTLSKLVKELGYDADVHGFRTSFRTWAQEQTNYPREVAEAALAHAVGDAVEQAYARSDVLEKRRKMMEDWGSYLAGQTLREEARLWPTK